MTRLSTSIKEALMKNLLERAFKDRVNDLIGRQAAFARRVYEDAMGADLPKILAMPEGWLPTDTDIQVRFGAEVTKLYFWGTGTEYNVSATLKLAGGKYWDGPNELRFPQRKKGGMCKLYEATHPLADEFESLRNERRELTAEIDTAKTTAQLAMDKCTTVKRLIQVWPEVADIAKQYLEDGERKAVLPAIPRDMLNNLLNLPPE